jgi:PKD repeat protein
MAAVSVAARAVLATILLFSIITIVYAGAPALPCEFYGKVAIEGSPAPAGTIVVAKVGEQERGQFVLEQEGTYGGPGTFDKRLKVVTEESDLAAGSPKVSFYVNGQKAWQEVTFQPGVSQALDLSVGGEEPSPGQSPEAVSDSSLKSAADSPGISPGAEPEPPSEPTPPPTPTVPPTGSPTTSPTTQPTTPPTPTVPPTPTGTPTTEPTVPPTVSPTETPIPGGLTADFEAEPDTGQAPLTVQFTDTSAGSPIMWSWDFGDGSSDFIADPVHIYELPGVYTVSLTVADINGATDTETREACIIVSPEGEIVANFLAVPLSGQAPLTVQFTDISTGDPTMWSWDFGDGTRDMVASPSHLYQNPGTYTVTLTASNHEGVSDTETKIDYITVTGSGTLSADFTGTPTSGNVPLSVYFTDKSTGTPSSWSWDFGDGQTDTRKDTVHIYNQPGLYTVALTVMDNNGTKSATQKEAYISVLTPGELIADFTAEPTSGTVPLKVQFTDTSVGIPTLWSWDFGDGTSDIVANPVHVYENAGNYTATLTISNQEGGISTKTRKDYLKVKPVPTPVPTLTVIPIPQVPESFYGSVEIYGKPISVGGTVEARVPGYTLVSEFNPIKTAKGVFGKVGTFSPKLQVQGIPVGTDIEFWVADTENREIRAYIEDHDGNLKWSEPFEPGKEKEIRLVVSEGQPTVIPTIPITATPTDCPGVPAIPMTFSGDLHITNGTEYLYENSSCMNCGPNAQSGAQIEAKIEGYDVTGPSNPITLTNAYFGDDNSSWINKLVVQGRCVPEDANVTFWVTAANWQQSLQAYLKDGNTYYKEIVYDPSTENPIHLWVGPVPTVIPTPTPSPTPEVWSPQRFYGKAEFNGYPLREGDRVMATTEGIDLNSPTNPISVQKLGQFGDPVGNEMLTVEVPYYALNQSDPINFWIKPQGFEYWYKAMVKNPLSSDSWKDNYPFTPGSITNLDIYSNDRAAFTYFYDIVTTIKNVILPTDYTGW